MLEPKFMANSLSRTALRSRGRKAERRDVELCMSYLFVARVDEPGLDSEDNSSPGLDD